MCIPDEGGGLAVHSSAQTVNDVHELVCHALGKLAADVTARCRRLGGGFGGKARRNLPVAAACALAADTLGRPVSLELDRCAKAAFGEERVEVRVPADLVRYALPAAAALLPRGVASAA